MNEVYGSIGNHLSAVELRGCRVRYSASVQARDVEDLAALWMRASDADGRPRAFDNMRSRAIRGTTAWSRQEIILDIPIDAERVDFGAMLSASGAIAIKDVMLEVFPPTTTRAIGEAWSLSGVHVDAYEIGDVLEHGILSSRYIRSTKAVPDGEGRLMLYTPAKDALGKKLRLSAELRTEKVSQSAGLWMAATGAGPEALASRNMAGKPIRGTTGWKRYQIVLEVPNEATGVIFGVQLKGDGQVWARNVSVRTLDKVAPATRPPRRTGS